VQEISNEPPGKTFFIPLEHLISHKSKVAISALEQLSTFDTSPSGNIAQILLGEVLQLLITVEIYRLSDAAFALIRAANEATRSVAEERIPD
jgi:hypothetical protein